jgi:hypothetical protein
MRERRAEGANEGLDVVDDIRTILDNYGLFVADWESAAAELARKETSL